MTASGLDMNVKRNRKASRRAILLRLERTLGSMLRRGIYGGGQLITRRSAAAMSEAASCTIYLSA